MASNRHLGRIVALQTLYEYEFRQESEGDAADVSAILTRNLERYEKTIDDTAFVDRLVRGVIADQVQLDETLQPIAPDWPVKDINRIDRTVLRMGLYELLNFADIVPPKVVINEAVELAKAFGSDNSSKFVNGVLGTSLRTLVEENSDGDAKSEV